MSHESPETGVLSGQTSPRAYPDFEKVAALGSVGVGVGELLSAISPRLLSAPQL